MRICLILVRFVLGATPAIAQVAPAGPPPAIQLPPQLADPATADRLVDAMQSLSHALLDLKVGKLQAVLEGRKATRSERNLTVRDLERRKDPNFERRLDDQIAAARPRMEQSIRAMNDALPEVTQDLEHARQALERAMANMPDPNYPRR
jgi:hypothetical protein